MEESPLNLGLICHQQERAIITPCKCSPSGHPYYPPQRFDMVLQGPRSFLLVPVFPGCHVHHCSTRISFPHFRSSIARKTLILSEAPDKQSLRYHRITRYHRLREVYPLPINS